MARLSLCSVLLALHSGKQKMNFNLSSFFSPHYSSSLFLVILILLLLYSLLFFFSFLSVTRYSHRSFFSSLLLVMFSFYYPRSFSFFSSYGSSCCLCLFHFSSFDSSSLVFIIQSFSKLLDTWCIQNFFMAVYIYRNTIIPHK